MGDEEERRHFQAMLSLQPHRRQMGGTNSIGQSESGQALGMGRE